jgi:hypothetical protein
MQIDSSQLDLFKTCFNGNENAYLTYDAKTGSYKTEHLPLTKKLYQAHLEGKISLGVFPIRNNKCNFGVIDDDFHHKSKKYNYQLIIVDESYTTKTCGCCGMINNFIGNSNIFWCSSCKIELERDYQAARNILIKNTK